MGNRSRLLTKEQPQPLVRKEIMDYMVRFYMNDEYEVYTLLEDEDGNQATERHFRGSLADCEAWIRLTNDGYM